MTNEVIGGPCTYGCGDVSGHPGVCLVTKLKPREHDPSSVKGRIADLERQLGEAKEKLDAAWDALDLELEAVKSSIQNLEQCPTSEDSHCNDVTRVHDRLLRQRGDLARILKEGNE